MSRPTLEDRFCDGVLRIVQPLFVFVIAVLTIRLGVEVWMVDQRSQARRDAFISEGRYPVEFQSEEKVGALVAASTPMK